jgi:PAS domain S-box-containing protein
MAEKSLKSMMHLPGEMSPAEIKKLVNSLQDHQLELEMQNEELLKARSRMEASHKKYVDLYDLAPIGYFTFGDKGLIIDANITAAEQLSIERISLIKKSFYQFIHKDDRDIFYLHCKEVHERKTRCACEIRLQRNDKSEFDAQLTSISMPDNGGNYSRIQTAVSNITRHKQSEKEQFRLQKRLEAQWELVRMVDADQDSICRQVLAEIIEMTESRYGFYGFLNDDESVMTIHSWSKETMADCRMSEKPIEFAIERSGVWGNAVRERSSLIINNYNEKYPNKKGIPEGHVAIHRLIAVPIIRHGKIVALGAVANKATDYTEKDAEQMISFLQSSQIIEEKRQSEEELTKHRERLMDLVDERTHELQQMNEALEQEICERIKTENDMKLMALFAELNPSPVLRFDKNGKVLMANSAAVMILDLESLTAIQLPSLIPGIEGLDFAACIRDGTILSHSAQIGERVFHFIFRGLPDLDIGQIYGSDITEQRHAEAESIRAGHLASIGELAAGVAHEINNPINGIINYGQIVADKTGKGSLENDTAIEIMKEGERIAGIVRNLLSFARYENDTKRPVRIHDIMSESLAVMQAQLQKEGILLKIHLPSILPEITVHFQQIEQVCLNVINNARYALNQKFIGKHEDKILEILAEQVIIDSLPFVRVTFHDHGTGMSEDLQNRIMNPFFTTKPRDCGTGLGLSISNNIVKEHGGSIKIEAIEGAFTKLIIDLPANA